MKRLTFGFLILLLSACGGGGGSSSGVIPGSNSPGSVPSNSLTGPIQSNGTVTTLWGGGFTMNTQSVHGYIHVYVNGSTQISGPQPYVGEQISVTGFGSFTTEITATVIVPMGQATPTPAGGSTPTPAPISTPSGFLSTGGTVVYISGSKMTVASGYPHGNIPVTLASNNATFGGTPAMNTYVTVTGTGSLSSNLTAYATSVWSGPPPSVQFSGTVVGGTTYGFTVNVDAAHPAVPVILNSSSVIAGGVLQAGALVRVSGNGSIDVSVLGVQIVATDPTPAPSPNSTPTPTPGPISQTHVMTAAYLGGYYGTNKIPWSAAAPYLNWAETGVTDANAISSAGIKTMFYTDPNHVQVGDPMYTTDESTFAHDCSGNRVTVNFNGITQYVMDPTSASLQTLYHNTVATQIGGAHFDAVFQDNTDPVTGPPMYSAYPCNYTDSAWMSGLQALSQAAVAPVTFNGLSDLNGHNPSVTLSILPSSNVFSGSFEHCYTDSSTPKANAWLWQATENTELQTAAAGKTFDCQERNTADGAASVDARLYAYASFLLSYNPATSMLWETFGSQPSGFTVFPETELVALAPVVATPPQIASLQINGGVYGREYTRCYIAGQFVGPCAVAVNSDPQNTYPFPYPQYSHSLVLSGESVVDGGTISASGPAQGSYMAPMSSAIVFP